MGPVATIQLKPDPTRSAARSRGVAVLARPGAGDTRVFVCDEEHHCIRVFDGAGHQVTAFGGYGTGPGQCAHPVDLALVRPRLPREPADADAMEPLLAVADRSNSRVQVLTLDGVFIASIGGQSHTVPENPEVPDPGWPFFRLTGHPILRHPCELTWRAPWLDVRCENDQVVSIDLAPALLPSYPEWCQHADTAERMRAARYFDLARLGKRTLPAAVFAAVTGRARDAAA